MAEVTNALEVHRKAGSTLAGIHLELTGQEVTECTGGCICLSEADLKKNYETYCDPRLNAKQALEAAFTVARALGPMCVETESKRAKRRKV